MEGVHDLLEAIILRLVPVGTIFHVEVRVEGVQVDPGVDACVGKGCHAAIVISGGIHVVDADGVGSECLHEIGVELALLGIGEWVVLSKLVGNTCERVRCGVCNGWRISHLSQSTESHPPGKACCLWPEWVGVRWWELRLQPGAAGSTGSSW